MKEKVVIIPEKRNDTNLIPKGGYHQKISKLKITISNLKFRLEKYKPKIKNVCDNCITYYPHLFGIVGTLWIIICGDYGTLQDMIPGFILCGISLGDYLASWCLVNIFGNNVKKLGRKIRSRKERKGR